MGFSEKSFKSISLAEGKERWKFIHDSVAMDFGLGVPYAVMHAFFYNMFASRKKNAAESNDITETAPGLAASQVSSETSFSEKHKPAGRVIDKVSANFVDKIGDRAAGEVQRA
jgi:hypothetical protein